MSDVLIAPPTVEPLTRTQAKLHLKSTAAAEDDLVDRLIAAARTHIEAHCRRALMLQTRRLVLDAFPESIEVQRSPLRAVQSIQYLDAQGALQTLAASVYRVDAKSEPGRIKPDYAQAWPATYPVLNAVTVTYTAGHLMPFTADAATDLLTAAGHGFTNGEVSQVRTIGGVLPTGLSPAVNYYVRDAVADTLKLAATSGGAAIDITAAGTPPNVLGHLDKDIEAALLLLIADFEQHRGEVVTGTLVQQIPHGVEALLSPYRIHRF